MKIDWRDFLMVAGVMMVGYFIQHVAGWPGAIGFAGAVLVTLAAVLAREAGSKKG